MDQRRSPGRGTRAAQGVAPDYWTAERQAEARQRLLERAAALRADIERERGKLTSDRESAVADRVRDPGDQSVADLTMDTDLSEIQRDADELAAIGAALDRVAAGTYGTCVECGQAIDPARLERIPEAARDVECERQIESRKGGSDATPTL
jgi:RNA polymerase-binding transcription factor DksA